MWRSILRRFCWIVICTDPIARTQPKAPRSGSHDIRESARDPNQATAGSLISCAGSVDDKTAFHVFVVSSRKRRRHIEMRMGPHAIPEHA